MERGRIKLTHTHTHTINIYPNTLHCSSHPFSPSSINSLLFRLRFQLSAFFSTQLFKSIFITSLFPVSFPILFLSLTLSLTLFLSLSKFNSTQFNSIPSVQFELLANHQPLIPSFLFHPFTPPTHTQTRTHVHTYTHTLDFPHPPYSSAR